MPTYDLECRGCGERFEFFRPGFLRGEDRGCPECGEPGAEQRLTAGFVAGVSAPVAGVELGGGGRGGCCGGSCGCGGGA